MDLLGFFNVSGTVVVIQRQARHNPFPKGAYSLGRGETVAFTVTLEVL